MPKLRQTTSRQPIAPAPMRQGESAVAYITREARRRRVKPWQLPGLSYLTPPVIGSAYRLANVNPTAWLRALDDALRAGRTSDPTDGLRDLVGRSSPMLPFSSDERAIWRWAWSGSPSPVNAAVWALRYMRTAAEQVARAGGATATQTRAAGQAAVDQSGDVAVEENRQALQQSMRAASAVNQARLNRLQAQLRLIETVAPQNAIPRAAESAAQAVTRTSRAVGSIMKPALITASVVGAGALAFYLLTRR